MSRLELKKRRWVTVPPWIILGAVLILAPIFFFLTIEKLHKEKEHTTKLLLEKGAALIRSFEAGARTGMMGMMGMHGGTFQLQRLLMETAQQPDIVYLIVTDSHGTILAHSDPSKIGLRYGTQLDLGRIANSRTIEWRRVTGPSGTHTFEVFRRFSPTRGYFGTGGRGMMERMMPRALSEDLEKVIFVGLDMGPVEAAMAEDSRHTIVMTVFLLLIGLAGVVSLFLAQAYQSTRTSLSRVKAFSDKLVENMPLGLLAIDVKGTIASFNEIGETVLGIPAFEAFGKPAEEVLPREFVDLTKRLKDQRGIIGEEIACAGKNGEIIPLDVIATPLLEDTGALMGYLILFRDLSEIRSLQREIERSQRLASIGRLAAGMAHEIRNPLSAIKGFSTYFRDRYQEIPQDRKTAEIMIEEVERLDRVIGQLLEFARPMDLQKRGTVLQELLDHSLKMIEADAKRNEVRLVKKFPEEVVEAQIDPDKMKQVFLNLFLNALEAMNGGGELLVELARDDGGRHVEISVSDTGTGIKESDLAHVFDPYFTTKPSGTGLGLAIVHKIVEAHGGTVTLKNRFRQGTRVSLSIPLPTEDRV